MDKLKEINWKKEGLQMARDYALIVAGALLTAMSFVWFFRRTTLRRAA